MLLRASASPDECADWLRAQLPPPYAAAAASASLARRLDGAALLALTEDDLGGCLGLDKFGLKRKLALRLSEAAEAAKKPSPAAEAPAAPDTTPPAGGEADLDDTESLSARACEQQMEDERCSLEMVGRVGCKLSNLQT